MDMDALRSLRDDILFCAAPDCVLFMWCVFPMMPDAISLMRHWGFQYKTGGAWHKKTVNGKTAFGTGYIFRSACEPFIVGTIGNPRAKNKSTRNIIDAVVREHSRKPDETVEMIEALFNGPYLELFGRTQRPEWTVWGDEAGKFVS
jgi:N6-adenosine-specific RNA methylase IME4